MKNYIFKILLVTLTTLNLLIGFFLAFILFQQVTDENLFTDLEPGKIVVIQVEPGGASDRAGLKVGDVINQINHQSFKDRFEADAIMRSNSPGSILQYDILRDDQPLQIFVQLARIQVRLYYLLFCATGLMLMALGFLVGWKRAYLSEARIYAFSMVLISIILFTVGRYQGQITFFRYLLSGWVFLSLFFGLAANSHAAMYFPVNKFKETKHYRLAKYYYLVAGFSFLVSLFLLIQFGLPSGIHNLSIFLYLILIIPISIYSWLKTSPDYRKIGWRILIPMRIFLTIIISLGVYLVFFMQKKFISGDLLFLSLFLIPLIDVYLIQKFRVFNIYLVIRRTGLYRIVNIAFMLLSIILFLVLVRTLTYWEVNLPTIYYHAGAFDFLWTKDIPGDEQVILQRATVIGIGIFIAFILYLGLLNLKTWLDRKFYREKYNYRKALSEFLKIVPATLDLSTFFQKFIEKLVEIMHLKGAFLIYNQKVIATYGLQFEMPVDVQYIQLNHLTPVPVTHLSQVGLQKYLKQKGVEFIIPVINREHEIVAILFCGEKRSESNYNQEDVEFLQAIANYLVISLNQLELQLEVQEKERIEGELSLARKIQRSSLPMSDISLAELETASFIEPAFEVGGDYFDYIQLNPRSLGIFIGDVSGKGTSAALHVAKIQGIIRSLFPIYREPGKLFNNLNERLYFDTPRNTFFTAIGSVFDLDKKEVQLVRAGHTPFIYYNAHTSKAQQMVGKGIGMGLVHNGLFAKKLEIQVIPYLPGDIFIFYTDGLEEMMDAGHNLYGEDRVLQLIEETHLNSAGEIRETIIKNLWQFKGTHQQHDDITLIVVKILSTNLSDIL
ncbi:SpoIIE family protein phosphatase [candidate division KSB1 bacterium]|nr:SpoIIE family protein phosphatase [candidate division KSB1 bacterium]